MKLTEARQRERRILSVLAEADEDHGYFGFEAGSGYAITESGRRALAEGEGK